jgi:hypothetical protein
MTVEFDDRLRFWTDWPVDNHVLLVAIPAVIGNTIEDAALLFDSASDCCIINAANAREAGWPGGLGLGTQWLSSRLGTFEGTIDRLQLTFRGFNGESMIIDATWLIIEDWPGPTVLGWKGCLERMRFAVEPMDNWFYFAPA